MKQPGRYCVTELPPLRVASFLLTDRQTDRETSQINRESTKNERVPHSVALCMFVSE